MIWLCTVGHIGFPLCINYKVYAKAGSQNRSIKRAHIATHQLRICKPVETSILKWSYVLSDNTNWNFETKHGEYLDVLVLFGDKDQGQWGWMCCQNNMIKYGGSQVSPGLLGVCVGTLTFSEYKSCGHNSLTQMLNLTDSHQAGTDNFCPLWPNFSSFVW